jgi:hypothetical protein
MILHFIVGILAPYWMYGSETLYTGSNYVTIGECERACCLVAHVIANEQHVCKSCNIHWLKVQTGCHV